MAKKSKKNFYAVAKGRRPGIYRSWEDCRKQTDGFARPVFKGFQTKAEADAFLAEKTGIAPAPQRQIEQQGRTERIESSSVAASSMSVMAASSSAGSVAGVQQKSSSSRYNINTARAAGGDGLTSASPPLFMSGLAVPITASDAYGAGQIRTSNALTSSTQPSSGGRRLCVAMEIHFDGGSRGNNGTCAGSGAELLVRPDTEGYGPSSPWAKLYAVHMRKYLEPNATGIPAGTINTNNVAEYEGLLLGLHEALGRARARLEELVRNGDSSLYDVVEFNLKVYGDSNLIIKQLKGEYQCKSPNIRHLYNEAAQLSQDWRMLGWPSGGNVGSTLSGQKESRVVSKISFQHVYRNDNKVADSLANEAMDQRRSWTTEE